MCIYRLFNYKRFKFKTIAKQIYRSDNLIWYDRLWFFLLHTTYRSFSPLLAYGSGPLMIDGRNLIFILDKVNISISNINAIIFKPNNFSWIKTKSSKKIDSICIFSYTNRIQGILFYWEYMSIHHMPQSLQKEGSI